MSKEIEDIFKEKFENFESVPSADLFDKIQAKRKHNKRKMLWWYAAIIGLIFVIGTLLILPKGDSTDKLVKNNTTTTATDMETSESNIEVERQNDVEQVNRDIVKSEDITAQKRIETPKPALEKPIKIDKLAGTSPPQNSNIVNADLANKFNQILAEKGIKNPEKATVYAKDKMYDVGQRPKIAPKQKGNDDVLPKLDNDETSMTIESNNTIATTNLDAMDSKVNDPEENELPNNAHKMSRWSIQATIGPNLGSRLLSGNENSKKLRNETETPTLSYAADFQLLYNINSKWNIGAGINYIKRNETFDYTKTTVTEHQIITFDTFTVYQNPLPPRQLIVSDTIYNTSTENQNYNSTNSYQVVQIPLIVERMFLTNGKWSFYSKLSANAIIWQAAKGMMLYGDDGNVVELNQIAKNKLGFNALSAGVGVGYKLNEQFNLLIYPTANYQFTSVFGNSYALKQNEIALFSSIGLRYQF